MEKKIIHMDKEYTLTTTPGNCYECEYEEPCKNFHCSGAQCGVTGHCTGHTGKDEYCLFKDVDDE